MRPCRRSQRLIVAGRLVVALEEVVDAPRLVRRIEDEVLQASEYHLVVAASGQSWIWTVENSSSQSAFVISHFTVVMAHKDGVATGLPDVAMAGAEGDNPRTRRVLPPWM